MTKSMYDIIKRQNGEVFAKAIRQFDSGIFDIPDLPRIVQYAGRNVEPLLQVLEGMKINIHQTVKTDKSPFELLQEAGYDAFYVDSLEKQNSIRKYFDKGEELCTFRYETRYQKYHIIHCIKKGADKLKRKDFLGKEQRGDEYATSVISIQILKEGGFIKITNRYNHTVENPDNTFFSNPDNIIKGLSDAFRKYFNILLASPEIDLPFGYLITSGADGCKIINYYTEENNVFLASKGYVKDGIFYKINPDSELFIDNFLIDLKNKKVINICESEDALYCVLTRMLNGKKLNVKSFGRGEKILFLDRKEVLKIRDNRIISITYMDEFIPPKVFNFNAFLEKFEAPNLKKLENCLNDCRHLKEVTINSCSEVLNSLGNLSKDVKINANKLFEKGIIQVASYLINTTKEGYGHFITGFNKYLLGLLNEEFEHKKMEVTYKGDEIILSQNNKQTVVFRNGEIVALHLEKIRYLFYGPGDFCNTLERLSLPNLENLSLRSFSEQNSKLTYLSVPKLKKVEKDCFKYGIKELYAPNLEEIEDGAFYDFKGDCLYLPKLRKIGKNCFVKTKEKALLFAPNLVADKKNLPFLMISLTTWRPQMIVLNNNDYLIHYKRKSLCLNRQQGG